PAGEILDWFYHERVGRYWPPERAVVDAGLATIPFPLPELPAPAFAMQAHFTLDALVGYVSTWSATHACTRAEGRSPLPELWQRLERFWPATGTREVRWPVAMRIGRAS
ncbi:MAG TPA: hypothetical protein VFX50_10590, partial [Gemmatimonadales bacterium]|nr:hypothetical protein [Gemmatimonadales bacterium]